MPHIPTSLQITRNRWLSAGLAPLLAGAGACDEAGGEAPTAVRTQTFVSSPDGPTAELAKDYTPFRFDYPSSFRIVENGREADDNFFVRMVRGDENSVAESFLVGSMVNRPDAAQDPTVLSPMIDEIGAQLEGLKVVKTGPHTLGGSPGLQFTFSTTQGGGESWGRGILLPGADGRGLWLVMLATPRAETVEGPAHVGERGELPVILKSFRMGKQ